MIAGVTEPAGTKVGSGMDPLRRCTGDTEAFLDGTWGARAALHPAAEPEGFQDLLTLDDVDRILTTTSLRTPSFRLVKAGEQILAAPAEQATQFRLVVDDAAERRRQDRAALHQPADGSLV